ncbi:50S ribosomal protein L18e [Candidatus Woesearchaeota archaeon]|nr:50S ribosomal protein L18e [Candidatus Woesearchaeota archaeon]
MKRTGTTNQHMEALISELKRQAIEKEQPLWKRIATDLERSTRQRRVVNLSRINRFTSEGDLIVVPGKVLSSGELDHSLTIAAWRFSDQARKKISEHKAKAISINELMNTNIKGKKIKIIG